MFHFRKTFGGGFCRRCLTFGQEIFCQRTGGIFAVVIRCGSDVNGHAICRIKFKLTVLSLDGAVACNGVVDSGKLNAQVGFAVGGLTASDQCIVAACVDVEVATSLDSAAKGNLTWLVGGDVYNDDLVHRADGYLAFEVDSVDGVLSRGDCRIQIQIASIVFGVSLQAKIQQQLSHRLVTSWHDSRSHQGLLKFLGFTIFAFKQQLSHSVNFLSNAFFYFGNWWPCPD